MKYLLVDNGSLRAESVLNLRRIAGELSARIGVEVLPASLLHSSKIPPEQLEGEPAVNLERRLRWSLETGIRAFTVIPFFFGPTNAILDYLPKRLQHLRKKFGSFEISRTPFLYQEQDAGGNAELVSILADGVRQCMSHSGLRHPRVALVDHGSPLQAVTMVRNELAERLDNELSNEVECVAPASMERRPGDAYAFNEPLLERLLTKEKWCNADVVVAMLFLSPGRHAGPGGDVARICNAAREAAPGLRTHMTPLVGEHPRIVDLLERRLKEKRLPLE